MNNFVKPGVVLTLTAPTGGVVGGTAYLIGALLVVAVASVAETLAFEGQVEGVFTLPKHTGTAWTEGELLYWDDTAKNITTVSTANTRVGVAAAAAASGDTTGRVALTGMPSPTQSIIPAGIVEDTGAISASATVTLTQAALIVQSARVVTSGTGASVGTYMVADNGATPTLPTGGASAGVGIAKISADGLTITFPNTITRAVIQYVPRA